MFSAPLEVRCLAPWWRGRVASAEQARRFLVAMCCILQRDALPLHAGQTPGRCRQSRGAKLRRGARVHPLPTGAQMTELSTPCPLLAWHLAPLLLAHRATRVRPPSHRASRAVTHRRHPHDQRLEAARHSIAAQDCACTARQRALAFACAHACRGSRGATATLVDSSPPKVHCLIVAPARITAVSTSARSGPQGFALRIARAVFGLAFFCSASAIQLRRRRETNDEEIQP